MFETFGEFNCAEEMNAAAAGQKDQGDKDALLKLAQENGIDTTSAELFWNGDISELTDYFSAAIGKLAIERENLKSNMPVAPIVDYLSSLCMEEAFARLIRCKDKSLKGCIDHTEKLCREECNRTKRQYVADMVVFQWAREYYTED